MDQLRGQHRPAQHQLVVAAVGWLGAAGQIGRDGAATVTIVADTFGALRQYSRQLLGDLIMKSSCFYPLTSAAWRAIWSVVSGAACQGAAIRKWTLQLECPNPSQSWAQRRRLVDSPRRPA